MAHRWGNKNLNTPAEQARRAKYQDPKHKAIREARFAVTTPATPCGYCGKPLGPRYGLSRTGRTLGLWHTPHAPNGIDYLPGVWHASCNQREASPRGARTTNAERKQRKQGPFKRDQW